MECLFARRVSMIRVWENEIFIWAPGKERANLPLEPEDVRFLENVEKLDRSRLSRDLFGESARGAIERLLTAAFQAGLEAGRAEVTKSPTED